MKSMGYLLRSVRNQFAYFQLVTKVKVTHLLKRSAKLATKRIPAKTYRLSAEMLEENKEEEREDDDMK